MNRRPPGLLISKAVEGFGQFKQAEGLSPRTVDGYSRDLGKWLAYQGDSVLSRVTAVQLRGYLTYLKTEYQPKRFDRANTLGLSPKTVHNVWITLSAFFHWASDEFTIINPRNQSLIRSLLSEGEWQRLREKAGR